MIEIGLGSVGMVADFIEPTVEGAVKVGEDFADMLRSMIE